LERLLRSGARFADKAIVLEALDRSEAMVVATRRVGRGLAFERMWEETGCRGVINSANSPDRREFRRSSLWAIGSPLRSARPSPSRPSAP
jgi:hypothetical protein